MLCHAVRREIHESCSGSGEEQNRRFKSTCIRASFSWFFDLAVAIFACAHFRTSPLARARAHSRDFCRTCESKAMRRELHHHSHCFFVVTWHRFSKCCYFSSQKHGFPFLARDVVLLFKSFRRSRSAPRCSHSNIVIMGADGRISSSAGRRLSSLKKVCQTLQIPGRNEHVLAAAATARKI